MERESQMFARSYESDKKTTVLKLVPTFSGEGDVSEWLEKVEMVCRLNDVTADQDVLYVITLRLTGEAYRVVQQMEPGLRMQKGRVIAALVEAYEVGVHDAYDMFRARRWKEGECGRLPVNAAKTGRAQRWCERKNADGCIRVRAAGSCEGRGEGKCRSRATELGECGGTGKADHQQDGP